MEETKRYWFVNKKVGIGWVPATWEGWLMILLYVVAMFSLVRSTLSEKVITQDFFVFIIGTSLLLILLMTICIKFGEPLEWRFWTKRKK